MMGHLVEAEGEMFGAQLSQPQTGHLFLHLR